jgi:hypothetical protein
MHERFCQWQRRTGFVVLFGVDGGIWSARGAESQVSSQLVTLSRLA